MYQMENYLEKECADLNWTVVRPPGLKNIPATGKRIIVAASIKQGFAKSVNGNVDG